MSQGLVLGSKQNLLYSGEKGISYYQAEMVSRHDNTKLQTRLATYQFLELGIIQLLDVVLGPIGEDHQVGLGRVLAAALVGGAAVLGGAAPKQRGGAPDAAVQAAAVAAGHAKGDAGVLADDEVVAAGDEAAQVPGAAPAVEADAAVVRGRIAARARRDVAAHGVGARAGPRAGVELDVHGRGEAGGEAQDGGDSDEEHFEGCG